MKNNPEQSSFLRGDPHGRIWFENPEKEVAQAKQEAVVDQKEWTKVGSEVSNADEEPNKVVREIIRWRQESGGVTLREARRKANYANQSRPKIRIMASADQIEAARYKKRSG